MSTKTNISTSHLNSAGRRLAFSNRRWVRARYELTTTHFEGTCISIARGQSIGNPTIHSSMEDKKLVRTYCTRWLGDKNLSVTDMYFPKRNFGKEGLNYLLSVLMGGQCDIDLIEKCRLIDVDLTALAARLPGPRYGIEGIRKLIGAHNRPLIGGIIKPKIGISPKQIAQICLEMAEGGIDFIKEDEILADQFWCPMSERVQTVLDVLRGYPVIYAPCITGDGSEVLRKAKRVKALGAKAVHLNIWSSLGAYAELRKKVDIAIFFQKSGDKVWTTGPYSIDYSVICKMVNQIGCDFAHIGMYGGYLAEPFATLRSRQMALGNTIPSFSCGVKPEHVPKLRELFGNDIMITSGGYICGHQDGITKAVKEFREQISVS